MFLSFSWFLFWLLWGWRSEAEAEVEAGSLKHVSIHCSLAKKMKKKLEIERRREIRGVMGGGSFLGMATGRVPC